MAGQRVYPSDLLGDYAVALAVEKLARNAGANEQTVIERLREEAKRWGDCPPLRQAFERRVRELEAK